MGGGKRRLWKSLGFENTIKKATAIFGTYIHTTAQSRAWEVSLSEKNPKKLSSEKFVTSFQSINPIIEMKNALACLYLSAVPEHEI